MPKRKTTDKAYKDLTQDVDVRALQENVRAFFENFPDPRTRHIYPAWYLILVMLCGYLAGGNTVADIAHFAELRADWLNSLLGTTFKPISYDTIWWFLVRVQPQVFKELLVRWLQALPQSLKDQLLAVDGKRLRGISDSQHISHFVELFATDSRLVIAQERVPNKKCERAALPQLLQAVDVQGAIISLDAHYAYIPDLQFILQSGADFIVGIKGNQGNLEAALANYFNQAHAIDYDDETLECYEDVDKGHGRIEIRHVCVSHDLDWLDERKAWGFQSIVEVRSERIIGDQTENGVRYYACSRKGSPKEFAKWIRGHWGIESLHHIADVVFEEDASLTDTGHSAENVALIRRVVMNVIKTVDPVRGMADARRNACFSPEYLRGVLAALFMGC